MSAVICNAVICADKRFHHQSIQEICLNAPARLFPSIHMFPHTWLRIFLITSSFNKAIQQQKYQHQFSLQIESFNLFMADERTISNLSLSFRIYKDQLTTTIHQLKGQRKATTIEEKNKKKALKKNMAAYFKKLLHKS